MGTGTMSHGDWKRLLDFGAEDEVALGALGEMVGVEAALAEDLFGRLVAKVAAGLAHEIRNPLNAAQLQLRVVESRLTRNEVPDTSGALAALARVESELQRLARMVDEIVTLVEGNCAPSEP